MHDDIICEEAGNFSWTTDMCYTLQKGIVPLTNILCLVNHNTYICGQSGSFVL